MKKSTILATISLSIFQLSCGSGGFDFVDETTSLTQGQADGVARGYMGAAGTVIDFTEVDELEEYKTKPTNRIGIGCDGGGNIYNAGSLNASAGLDKISHDYKVTIDEICKSACATVDSMGFGTDTPETCVTIDDNGLFNQGNTAMTVDAGDTNANFTTVSHIRGSISVTGPQVTPGVCNVDLTYTITGAGGINANYSQAQGTVKVEGTICSQTVSVSYEGNL